MATYYVDGAVGNDANAGTSPGAGNAWATIGHAASTVAAGDKVNVKNSASYAELVAITTSGSVTANIVWEGYTTTVGDGGRAIIEGGNTRATCLHLADKIFNVWKNFTFQGATTQIIGWSGTAEIRFYNCRILKGTGAAPVSMQATSGFSFPLSAFVGCEVGNFAGAGIQNVNIVQVAYCDIHDLGGVGISAAGFHPVGPIIGNRIYTCTGNGIGIGPTSEPFAGYGVVITSNSIYACADGINIDGGTNGTCLIANNVITAGTGWGINVPNALAGTSCIVEGSNFFYSNASGTISSAARVVNFVADVTLSGSPFTSPGTGDMSLNNTASAGALVRALAWPHTAASGTTTLYNDGGSAQHQDAGGGTTNIFLTRRIISR